MYDAAIVGAGPAGVSAALNLKARNKSFVLIGQSSLSAKARTAHTVANYPGLPMISGNGLMDAMAAQLTELDIPVTEAMVTGIYAAECGYQLLCENQVLESRTVILTTGVATTTIPGEMEFLGRGVSYCATCDGFLYKEKTIAVICPSRQFDDEVQYLADIAGRCYLFAYGREIAPPNDRTRVMRARPQRIRGDLKVRQLVTDLDTLQVDGVFFLKDSFAPNSLLQELELQDGSIRVNRSCETNVPGIFAAGDCTGKPYQFAKAVGEGNVAAHSVMEYLARTQPCGWTRGANA